MALRIVVVVVALLGAGCFNTSLAGHRCNEQHPCITGFACVDGTCVAGDGEGEGEGAGEGEGEGGEGEGEGSTCNVNAECPNGDVCDTNATSPTAATCIADCRITAAQCAPNQGCTDATGLCHDAVCGDGVKEGLEACDDGTSNSDTAANACRTTCALPRCGDGVVDTAFGESCDDGNIDPNDGCDNSCHSSLCGNGNLDPGEQCDDGAQNSDATPDACRTNCVNAHCGDGVVDTVDAEQCDDGANNSDTTANTCRSTCTLPTCGDGVVDPAFGESCDPPGQGCSASCKSDLCGNNIVDPGEQCDDGPNNSDTIPNHCRTTCVNPFCGDGVKDSGEQCDDGNHVDGDACDSNCTLPACGNGVLDPAEACDDGNLIDTDACRANCEAAACGDGVVETGVEQCDNGSLNSDTTANACRSDCQSAHCGDGVVDTGEQCDDGNTTSGDGCSATCQVEGGTAVCGNGVVEGPGEQCDDGNTASGDGCSATCTIETNKSCFGQPSICCPTASTANVSPGGSIATALANATQNGPGCVFVAAGTYSGAVSSNATAIIVGAGAGSTTMTSTIGDTLTPKGTASITVQGITITATGGIAVNVSQQATITLKHAVLGPAAKTCLTSTGSTTVNILQSQASGCIDGGLSIGSNTFDIENTFVTGNGTSASTFGGVQLTAPNAAGNVFRHNTVAQNTAPGGVAAGVECSSNQSTAIFGSIVWANAGIGGELSAQCSPASCDFEGAAANNGNIAVDPSFASAADFHLAAGSPCLDRITSSPTLIDFDGDARPQGTAWDIGADERR